MQGNRRTFLKLVAATSLAQGCTTSEEQPPQNFFKSTEAFIPHGTTNLETRLENLDGFLTPVDQFFVRNNDRSLDLAVDGYTLSVFGDAVSDPLNLSFDDLLSMPSRTVFSYLECGGNQRAFFGTILGQVAQGTQWGRGAVGMAEWTGVPLIEVLSRAGIKDSARMVQLIGMDEGAPEGGFRRPLPVAKAIDPDTILAYRMNGAPLPRDHGFPMRALVPGWVGSSSVKWLGAIEVSSENIWSRNNTTSYVLIGDDYPPEGEAQGVVATTQSIKSALALPWPAAIGEGPRLLRGYAHSPHAPISRVEWSLDGGTTWQEATVLDPVLSYSWARFEFQWAASPGTYQVMTRATDQEGNTQPDIIPHNAKGYLFNMPLPHPIVVSGAS